MRNKSQLEIETLEIKNKVLYKICLYLKLLYQNVVQPIESSYVFINYSKSTGSSET